MDVCICKLHWLPSVTQLSTPFQHQVAKICWNIVPNMSGPVDNFPQFSRYPSVGVVRVPLLGAQARILPPSILYALLKCSNLERISRGYWKEFYMLLKGNDTAPGVFRGQYIGKSIISSSWSPLGRSNGKLSGAVHHFKTFSIQFQAWNRSAVHKYCTPLDLLT